MNRDKKLKNERFEENARHFSSWVKKRERIDSVKVDHLWDEVAGKVFEESQEFPIRPFYKKRYMALSVAASVCLLIGFSVWLTLFYSPREFSASLFNQSPGVDSLKEVAVIIAGEQIHVADNASIRYDKQGILQVNRQRVPLSEKTEQKKINQLVVPKGRRTHITFSDGTSMYVNAGTRVIYPSVFDKDKREIRVEGEVYLEVIPDSSRPFIVRTGNFDVKVLGTAFNISAYKTDEAAFVVLVNGKVEIETAGNEKVILKPNQLFNMDAAGIRTEEVDVSKYICWKENAFLLENDKIGDVLIRLSRYYGITVTCEEEIYDVAISGKLDLRNDIEDVINLLMQPTYLQYRRNPDGTYHVFLNN